MQKSKEDLVTKEKLFLLVEMRGSIIVCLCGCVCVCVFLNMLHRTK